MDGVAGRLGGNFRGIRENRAYVLTELFGFSSPANELRIPFFLPDQPRTDTILKSQSHMLFPKMLSLR